MTVGAVAGPRVRFAPSPTGYFHVGSARTALFNWLFARGRGGVFILRIEDTDADRGREEWVTGIVSALSWLGLEPDEGPYRQSERAEIHARAVRDLWESGRLYACDCSREEVEARTRGNVVPGYDGFCRDRNLEPEGRALRFKTPKSGSTVVDDLVRGRVEFPNQAIEDFVVVKSTGHPLFVLANVLDDMAMGITHVIRGEDLLPSTPKALMIWRALRGEEAPLPKFAHLPMLVNEQRKKLSKRRDPVAVELYRDEGYLPEAFVNYLALLGWSPPDGREILPISDVIAQFEVQDVNHSPAFFDVKKLRHMNGEYIRAMAVPEFVERCRPFIEPPLAPWPAERFDHDVFVRIAPSVKERVTVLSEVCSMVDFFFLEQPATDEAAWAKVKAEPSSVEVLSDAVERYRKVEWNAQALHEVTASLAEAHDRKLSKAQAPIRVAVTGRSVGPPLFESLEVLGRELALLRMGEALRRLDAGVGN